MNQRRRGNSCLPLSMKQRFSRTVRPWNRFIVEKQSGIVARFHRSRLTNALFGKKKVALFRSSSMARGNETTFFPLNATPFRYRFPADFLILPAHLSVIVRQRVLLRENDSEQVPFRCTFLFFLLSFEISAQLPIIVASDQSRLKLATEESKWKVREHCASHQEGNFHFLKVILFTIRISFRVLSKYQRLWTLVKYRNCRKQIKFANTLFVKKSPSVFQYNFPPL